MTAGPARRNRPPSRPDTSKTQFVDRGAETGAFAGDAQVADAGDFQSAADAGAFDQRHLSDAGSRQWR